ncbi:MAG: zinc-dependent alcohol dehydrogenase family protein [Burkholderiales bacterium]|nr:zinc-dependent alcohol dehydrogenase family protein [Burkholderiales bacterium]
MTAMQLQQPGRPLQAATVPVPVPGEDQVLVRVHACAVCRTDLHIVDGDLTQGAYPLTPGHEVVGTVVARGARVEHLQDGQRVGVPWLGFTCGGCRFCRAGQENLCESARFTGYHLPGGYAQYAVADARYSFPIPSGYGDAQAAPLLCAGLIGYRALRMAGEARRIGLYGFGAAAHIVAQVAHHQGREIYAFTRPGDHGAQRFARELGACWAGDSTQPAPQPLDAALVFAPVGALVPAALAAVDKGGSVICAGIHMSAIPSFSYELLWGERMVRSVANLTRRDAEEFLALAPRVPVRTRTEIMPLAAAGEALNRLRSGEVHGALVLMP